MDIIISKYFLSYNISKQFNVNKNSVMINLLLINKYINKDGKYKLLKDAPLFKF